MFLKICTLQALREIAIIYFKCNFREDFSGNLFVIVASSLCFNILTAMPAP